MIQTSEQQIINELGLAPLMLNYSSIAHKNNPNFQHCCIRPTNQISPVYPTQQWSVQQHVLRRPILGKKLDICNKNSQIFQHQNSC